MNASETGLGSAIAGDGPSPTGVAADVATTFGMVRGAIQTCGGEIRSELAPRSARFTLSESSLVTTAGLRVTFNGELGISEIALRNSAVRVSVTASWSSLALQLVATCIVAVILGVTLGQLGSLIAIAAGAWQIYSLAARRPRELTTAIVSEIKRQSVARPATTRPSRESEVSLPIPNTREPAYAAPSSPTPAERLEQLVELRASGALTPEEFDARKAELLRSL